MQQFTAFVITLAFISCGTAASAPRLNIPLGITALLDDPACEVGFQRDGEEPYLLGWRWTGFDSSSGVYFVPEVHGGKPQVFMHCPWQKGPGITFADFPLHLPKTTRIRLNVSCALRSGAPASDGVTYRVKVDGRKLWEVNGAWKRWRNFTIDLSSFAGKSITLRLEVDPGPARNTRDDWSLWREVEVIAGTDAEVAAARVRREKERALRRRHELELGTKWANADLSPFARGDVATARPSTASPAKNTLSYDGHICVMACQTHEEIIEYRFDPTKPPLRGLAVAVNGVTLDPAPFTGGPRVVLGGRVYDAGSREIVVQLLSASVDKQTLLCQYKYSVARCTDTAVLTMRLHADGKSLVISLSGKANQFDGFEARAGGGIETQTTFCVGLAPVYHRQGVYVAAFADLWQSNASSVGGRSGRTYYAPLTDGTRRAMRDTFYLTVSSRYEETLPNVPHRPSPFLQELAHRVVMDVWGGAFAEDEKWLRDLAQYGVNKFLIIKHVWQRDGYDHTYPNVMPANARQGGDEALRRLSLTAQKLGHRFCVHENFYDYYPNAEAFRLEHCALLSNGKPQLGWDNGTYRARILKPSLLIQYAHRFSPEVKRRYDCNAAYHDIMPTWRVDFDAKVSDSGIIRRTHEYTKELCAYDRKLFGGPVVFEASTGAMAGIFDGGCNHGVGTYSTPPAVAFELLKVHPKMSNHGFGYYERWLPWGYSSGWGTYIMTDRELDHYRATVIAFGRTGFIGQQLRRHTHALVREYYLMQAFGRAYTGQELRQLAYFVESDGWHGWVDAGTACRLRTWQRIRATYEDKQEVYVNLSKSSWRVAEHTLPPYGTLTTGPRATAYTAVVDGQIADFAQYEDTLYVDARSHQWLPPEPLPPITPSLGNWKDNGDGTFNLTIDWKVGRRLLRNRIVFWHFKDGQKIMFQDDHAPARSTLKWEVGDVVKDGPRRVKVRSDQTQEDYDVVVGLYDKSDRAQLLRGANQVRVATLHVTRDGGRVTSIRLERCAEPEWAPGTDRESYLQDANRKKRVINFGPVATNGAVVMRRISTGVEIIPVPIGETMKVGLRGTYRRITALDGKGKALPNLAPKMAKGWTWFDLPKEAAKVVLR